MSYKTIQDTFWSDPKVKSLNYKERYLFLYLITNPCSHYSGIYRIYESVIVDETGMKIEDVKHSLYTLHAQELVVFNPAYSVVWVVNMLRHQVPIRSGTASPKVLRGIANHLTTLHKCPLIKDLIDYYIEYAIPYEYDGPSGEPVIEPETPESPANPGDPESDSPKKAVKQKRLDDEEWKAELLRLHPWLDWDQLNKDMDTWLLSHPGRQKTRQFVTNWILKEKDKRPIDQPKKDTW